MLCDLEEKSAPLSCMMCIDQRRCLVSSFEISSCISAEADFVLKISMIMNQTEGVVEFIFCAEDVHTA